MGYRYDEFAPGEVYHLFTRGVEQRTIFLSNRDRLRFLDLLVYSMPQGSLRSYSVAKKLNHAVRPTAEGEGLVDLISYCLMDNHVHLLVRENVEGGISRYMQRLLNAYARHFNIKNERSGSLFVHPFKGVLVDGDEQFLHVARYIHLNPYVAHLIADPLAYRWSSLSEYVSSTPSGFCHRSLLQSMLSREEHRKFVMDEADYARSLKDVQHLLLDFEDEAA